MKMNHYYGRKLASTPHTAGSIGACPMWNTASTRTTGFHRTRILWGGILRIFPAHGFFEGEAMGDPAGETVQGG